jgi:hypothetical protein
MKASIKFEYDPKDPYEVEDILDMQRVSDYKSIIGDMDNYLRSKIKYETPRLELAPEQNYFSPEDYKKDEHILQSLTPEQVEFIQSQITLVLEEVRQALWNFKSEHNLTD